MPVQPNQPVVWTRVQPLDNSKDARPASAGRELSKLKADRKSILNNTGSLSLDSSTSSNTMQQSDWMVG
jgi:hypothetical protein